MEASALQAPATLPQTRVAMGTPLLRFRSDEQLVALFRAGDEDAFRAIHDRYHKRLFAYARQMLPGRQDAEDALQDVFVRAYAGLRASDQQLALRAWLFRVAHNRCVDELRRPAPPAPEVLQLMRASVHDPLAEVDLRESLRRLIEDIRRLPEQQRSALLLRELGGMSYADLSASLGISVGAVKSLLVRARVALAQAAEARDTSCVLIREQLVEAHDRGMRPNATTRKHMRDCVGCKSFRRELRGMSRQLAAITPIGPLGILAKTLGFSGGAGGGAAGGGGLALLGGGGATASAGGVAVGVNHLAALLVAAVATAGGAVEIQHTIIPAAHHPAHARRATSHRHGAKAGHAHQAPGIQAIVGVVEATVSTAPKLAATAGTPAGKASKPRPRHKPTAGGAGISPSTGASAVSNASSTDAAASGSEPTGTDTSSATASTCSTLLASDTATSATSTASASPSATSASPQSTTTVAPCVGGSSSSDAGATSSSTGSSPSGSGTGDSSSNDSPAGSGTSQGTAGTASTGGSSSATK